jgi:glycosyltransferase involved in cell wall biosynthesis
MLSTKNTIIINDLDFFIEAYYVKKIKKNIKIIHYNTELPGKDVPYSNRIMKFYKKHADFPDMIIDCLEERASYRKKKWNINKKIWIINNTIPNDTIPRTIDKSLFTYTSFNNNFPILIYAGRCSDNEVIDALVNSMNNCNGINFLFFCHGEKKYKDKLINRCQSHIEAGICKIYDSISREKLLMIMQHCNIGVSFYDPNYSMNYRYASPSKIFEYIACGLQVISTNNEGINHLIINNRIGVCINENEKFENALNRLITSNLLDNYNIKKLFEDSLSYEHLSKNTINEIIKLIKA